MSDNNGRLYVRKTSKQESYNDRLRSQCIKQADFSHPFLSRPEILSDGFTPEGLYFFDMEYVKGETMASYIKTWPAYMMKDTISNIVANLIRIDSHINAEAQAIFQEKISQVAGSILNNDKTITATVERLQNYDWSKTLECECHGDLTLENIIVKGDELYLIDFLDSFYNSNLIDIAKILQDLIALWSFRNDPYLSANSSIRIKIFRDILIDSIREDDQQMQNILHILLLHLLRILPYANDVRVSDFVISKLKIVNDLISSHESYA